MRLTWGRRSGRVRSAAGAVVAAVVGTTIGMAALAPAASAAGTVTYSATQTIPVPPASSFAGSGGGDGWAVALSDTSVFNVFHHSGQLTVACHLQSDASACWTPRTVTDGGGSQFGTSGHPGLFLDQATGRLYVYATRQSDGTGGVVCVDTVAAATDPNPFCGFTALTAVGEAARSGMSDISAPAQVGTRWYAFNFVAGSAVSGTRNTLLCFDLSSHAACAAQPFTVGFGAGALSVGDFPPPAVTAVGGKVLVPVSVGAGEQLACFDPATNATCTGAWPIALSGFYVSNNGAAYPLLNGAGATVGFCLPTGADPCWNLSGASVPTPAGMTTAIRENTGWNGAALTLGPRVYVPNGNFDVVECYDAATSAGCANFPKALPGLSFLYTVNPDPRRPDCVWVNADSGSGQIQNFDAFSGGACGQGPIRVLASSFVVDSPLCQPASYSSLQVIDPPRSSYTDGSIAFQNGDAAPIPGAADRPLDATGTVDLSGLNLSTDTGLPQFLITLDGATGTPGAVTVRLTWTGTDDPSCAKPGTIVTGGGVQPGTDCPDLYFLGAAGSGQNTSDTAFFDGMGPQVDSVYRRLTQVLQAGFLREVDGHRLTYATASVSTLASNPSAYFDAVPGGVTQALADIRAVRTACPQEHIVLAGYSQGAMVMHRVLQRLVADGDTGTLAHLDGAVLIADGDRIPGDRTTNSGTASASGRGVGQLLTAASGSDATLLPASLQSRVQSICNRLDPVCDNPPTFDPSTVAARVPVHNGYTGSAPLLAATDAVAGQVRQTPAPAANLSKLKARAGVPVSQRLTADVAPAATLEWRQVPPYSLPPGWTLSPNGTVSGTTSFTGIWTTQVEVRATVSGVAGEWIPATVSWTITR